MLGARQVRSRIGIGPTKGLVTNYEEGRGGGGGVQHLRGGGEHVKFYPYEKCGGGGGGGAV